MNKALEKELIKIIKESKDFNSSYEEMEEIVFKYPFTKDVYILLKLQEEGLITPKDFLNLNEINNELFQNLDLFLYAPRPFGEKWAENFIIEKSRGNLVKASKKVDPNYDNEYDLFFKNLKIEVKASRAVLKEKNSKKSLIEKALDFETAKFERFEMNFQQLKPKLCDWVVLIAVFTDRIFCWLISSSDVLNNKYYSKGQHRGNDGEGQLWITWKNLSEFDHFLVDPSEIHKKLRK